MGSAFMSEFVPYQEDVRSAFDEMVQRLYSLHGFQPPAPESWPDPVANPDESQSYFLEVSEDPIRCLEIMRISSKRGPLMIGPVSASEMQSLFETVRPSRAQIEDSDISEFLGRGEGLYCTVFDGELPSGIFIAWQTVD
jgi:hypothetical protein